MSKREPRFPTVHVQPSAVASHGAIRRAARAAARRYKIHPNVLGVSVGKKFRRGQPTDTLSVQFFVKRKTKKPRTRPLPRFVYGVRRGRIDKSNRFPTDVIQVRKLTLVCGAGSVIQVTGEKGSMTLLFRNRDNTPGTPPYFLLTCAHVVGDLSRSPPLRPNVTSRPCAVAPVFAEVVKTGTISSGTVEYDIALAQLTPAAVSELGPAALAKLDGAVDGRGVVLTDYLPSNQIVEGLPIQFQGATSHSAVGTVDGYEGTFELPLPNGVIVDMKNLYKAILSVDRGDSGGIVYAGRRAVGLLVAKAVEGGFAWFHSLQDGVSYLNHLPPLVRVRCF